MDPNASQQTQESFIVFVQRKRFLIVGVIGALMLVSVGAAVLSSAGQQPEMAPVLPEEESTPSGSFPSPREPSPTPNAQQQQANVVTVVNTVLTAIKTGSLQTVTHYFMYGADYWQTEEGVLHTLRLEKTRFTDTGVYNTQVQAENVEITGNNAQVPVVHTIAGKQTTNRYDLIQTPAGWRITQILYNQEPDIVEVKKLQEEHVAGLDQPTYYQTPAPFTLPAGDIVEVEKTLFTALRTESGAHQDIELAVRTTRRNYTLALYDGAYIVDSAIILVNQPGTHAHSFDIRALQELHSGSLLFYPEGTTFDRTKPGKPAGMIYEIPIKLEIKE